MPSGEEKRLPSTTVRMGVQIEATCIVEIGRWALGEVKRVGGDGVGLFEAKNMY